MYVTKCIKEDAYIRRDSQRQGQAQGALGNHSLKNKQKINMLRQASSCDSSYQEERVQSTMLIKMCENSKSTWIKCI